MGTVNENELEVLSNQVNDVFNYVNEYRNRKIKANANDMMALYRIVSEYDNKIKGFMSNTNDQTKTNNQAQYIDLVARRADASENKRIIAEAIEKSMQEIVFDANKTKNILSKLLSDKEKNKKEAKDLLKALTDYDKKVNDPSVKADKKADAKVKLINSCIGYIKNFRGNADALNVVYDIAAVMGEQNSKAFDNLSDEQLRSLSERKYMGYQSTGATKKFVPHHMKLKFPANAPKEFEKLLTETEGKSQQDKEAAYEKYLNYMYGKDIFANYPDKDKVLKELGPNATEEEKYTKIGEKISEKMPWHNMKLDDTTTSKEKFAHRQQVMRQWFPDDTALLFGATAHKNKARSFLEDLSNPTFNGFLRSFYNSPEYTALMKSLYTYTKTLETDVVKDEANLKAVKDACNKYLQHYEDKEAKKKTEFAKMRRNKVEQLLLTLGGEVNVKTKDSKEATKEVKATTTTKETKAATQETKAKAPETAKKVKKLFKDNTQFKTLIEEQDVKYSASADKVVEQVNNGKELNLKDLARAFVDRGILNHLIDLGKKEIKREEYKENRELYRETLDKVRKTNYDKEIAKLMADDAFVNASKELKQGQCSEGAINNLFVKYVTEVKKPEPEVADKDVQKTTDKKPEVEQELVKKGWVLK